MKWILCILLCVACGKVQAENLLSNSGFDAIDLNGAPTAWDLFVLPGNGAVGEADRTAHDGDFAALLYTPKLYSKDPVNNWSQIIYDDLAGKEVTLSGHIRTERVSEAALWIQCFTKQRSRVLRASSSTQEFPLSGTNGWARVSTSIIPPEGTDFLVVRCIIMGEGKAWFDSLSLSIVTEDSHLSPALPPLEAIDIPADEDTIGDTNPTPPAPALNTEDIMAVSKQMQDTIRQLEQNNRELLMRISEIQGDLSEYRSELNQQNADSEVIVQQYGMHPLVPHGYAIELDQ